MPPEPPKKQDTKAADLKRAAEEKKAAQQLEAAQQAAAKRALDRALAQAGPAASTAGAGLSNAYRAQIVSCIRPHIIFNVPDAISPQQHVAEFEVMLLPTGEQASRTQVDQEQRPGGLRSGRGASDTPLRSVSTAEGGNDAAIGESAV